MSVTRIKNSSIANKGPKYDNMLAGLPYTPIIGTATDGGTGTTASVAFTKNNTAGLTYTALSTPGSLTGTGTASPITVTGLTSGTAYTFAVKATNSAGDSAYSAASNSVTPASPSSFESIATVTGTGSSGTITFSSIPSGYASLQIRVLARNDESSSFVSLRFNGDTGSNYAYHWLTGNGTAASAFGAATQTSISGGGGFTVADTELTSTAGVGIVDIIDYANTTKNKTTRTFAGWDYNAAGGQIRLASGLWQNTAAVNSITLFLSGGRLFTTATSVSLYGIKA